ncbi:MAG: NUDIX domain-containing protein [Patescibacteria group bacterium]|nr:NUDIX domain-containing protein [Patescibacteria group bacterium]
MKKEEVAAGIIVVYECEKGREYLLLKNRKGQWGFSKGHVETGEDMKQAALREVGEETGLTAQDLVFIPSFERRVTYSFSSRAIQGGSADKEVFYFLARVLRRAITLSPEHEEYGWYSCEEALHLISFRNMRALVKDAETFLREMK